MVMLCSKILVAYDGSHFADRALEKAMELAKMNASTELQVLYVENAPTITYEYTSNNQGMNKKIHVNDHKFLHVIEKELASLPNSTSLTVEAGSPAQVILEFTAKEKFDFIVMGSRGLTGLKELFLGSVSHFVAQNSTVPVLIVK